MDEIGAASTFLYGRLTAPAPALVAAGTALAGIVGARIFEYMAPPGTALPNLVFSLISSVDQSAQGDVRVFTAPLYLVEVVTQSTNFDAASQAYGLADQLLQGGYGYVSDNSQQFWVARCNREAVIERMEVGADGSYARMGGKYRLLVQPSPVAVPTSLAYPYA